MEDSTATVVSRTAYWSYPILPFGIVACTFFPTTFLEIAVHQLMQFHWSYILSVSSVFFVLVLFTTIILRLLFWVKMTLAYFWGIHSSYNSLWKGRFETESVSFLSLLNWGFFFNGKCRTVICVLNATWKRALSLRYLILSNLFYWVQL